MRGLRDMDSAQLGKVAAQSPPAADDIEIEAEAVVRRALQVVIAAEESEQFAEGFVVVRHLRGQFGADRLKVCRLPEGHGIEYLECGVFGGAVVGAQAFAVMLKVPVVV